MTDTNTNRPVRQCMADYQQMKDDDFVTEQTRVRYYGLTIKEIKENQAKAAAEEAEVAKKREQYIADAIKHDLTQIDAEAVADEKIAAEAAKQPSRWLSTLLADRLHSLPDIPGNDGKPIVISAENLEGLDLVNLKAIDAAIDADLSPKLTPATPPNG